MTLSICDAAITFGDQVALDGVDATVESGEIVVVLGPSGCGKSTLLRIVAGLVTPDRGRVLWDGVDLSPLPPHRRDFGLMFQDHALFPHLDVAANIGFGLRMRGAPGGSIAARVSELLGLVGMTGYGDRRVDTLSGGEAQRVALARALAPTPRLLMLDEPMGSLDRQLRERLVADLHRVLRTLGPATLHVTHDHEEAFTLADRLAVMGHGRILRVGPPDEVWSDPQSEFVARFLGHRNIIDIDDRGAAPFGTVASAPGRVLVRADGFLPAATPETGFEASVVSCRFAGDHHDVVVRTAVGHTELTLRWPGPLEVGSTLHLTIDPSSIAPLEA